VFLIQDGHMEVCYPIHLFKASSCEVENQRINKDKKDTNKIRSRIIFYSLTVRVLLNIMLQLTVHLLSFFQYLPEYGRKRLILVGCLL
jgi:phosphopantetheinyl transferase